MDGDAWSLDEGGWRCREHPSQPRTGVCPICLRNRLLRLCPDCARARPCACSVSCSTSSSSRTNSSCSISFSFSLPSHPLSGGEGSVGAIGRVSQLIESEPPFRRSRSAAANRWMPRSVGGEKEKKEKESALWWLWPFRMGGSKKRREEEEMNRVTGQMKEKKAEEAAAAARLFRSRSAGLARAEAPAAAMPPRHSNASADVRWKGWNWYFPSPMKAFGHRGKGSRLLQERSPLCRG